MQRKRKNISARTRWRVFNRDNFRCVYCGAGQESKLVIDHGDPFSKGGDDNESNYVTSCASCNAGKHDRVFIPASACESQSQPTDGEVVSRGVTYKNGLHADWADAFRQVSHDLTYMPDARVVSAISGSGELNAVIRPDFCCHFFRTPSKVRDERHNVVIVNRCDRGEMPHADKERIRNAAILGYTSPTVIIIGSPWFFYGIEVNDRYKGCPAGNIVNDWLHFIGEVYLTGWYPDETWEAADFRDYADVMPACVSGRAWHMTVQEAEKLHGNEVLRGI